jgi:hypothetical protein
MTPSVDKCFDFSCSPKVSKILNTTKGKKMKKLPPKPKMEEPMEEENEDSESEGVDKVYDQKEETPKIVVKEHVADEPETTTYEGDDTPEIRKEIIKSPKIKKALNTKPGSFNQKMKL